MRKFLASLGVVCLATAASAQTIDCTPLQQFRTDDGSGETAWKVTFPSGPSDWFNVDFGGMVSGVTAVAMLMDAVETGGVPGSFADLGAYTSNANGDPDVAAGRIGGQAGAPVAAGDAFSTTFCWSMPAITLGSDVHAAANWNAGDSHVWIDSDTTSTIANLSHFTGNGYATATSPFTLANWMMGFAGFGAGADGTLLVNGGSSATIAQNGTACLTFTACLPGVVSSLFLHFGGGLFGPLVPAFLTTTGNPISGGPLPNQWTLCATTDCNTPTGTFTFCTLYLDPCMLKPNGKPTAKISTTAVLTITPSKICQGCFGQKDDAILDSTIWKVQNPAGPSDWFNVDHGSPAASSAVSMLTGIEIASWDFCATGSPQTWGTLGLYPEVSGSPGVPDIGSPFTTSANPSMASGAADWTYPATFYDVPDISASTTTVYHVAVKWPAGDTCMWLGSDTDGTDSSCGNPTLSGTVFSYWTLNDYATGSNPFSSANWMMKIDWN